VSIRHSIVAFVPVLLLLPHSHAVVDDTWTCDSNWFIRSLWGSARQYRLTGCHTKTR